MADFQYQSIFKSFQEGRDRVADRRSQQNEDAMKVISAYQEQERLGQSAQRLYFDTVVAPQLARENATTAFNRSLQLESFRLDNDLLRDEAQFELNKQATEEAAREARRVALEKANEAGLLETHRKATADLNSARANLRAVTDSSGGITNSPRIAAARNAVAAAEERMNRVIGDAADLGVILSAPIIDPDTGVTRADPTAQPAPGQVLDGLQPTPISFTGDGTSTPPGGTPQIPPINFTASGDIETLGIYDGNTTVAYNYKSLIKTRVYLNPSATPSAAAAMARSGMNPDSVDMLAVMNSADGSTVGVPISKSLGSRRGDATAAVTYATRHAKIPASIRRTPGEVARLGYVMSVIAKIENGGRVWGDAKEGIMLQSGAHKGDRAQGGFQVMPNTAMRPQFGIPNVFEVAQSLGLLKTNARTKRAATLLLRDKRINAVFSMNLLSAAYEASGGDMLAVAASYVGGAGGMREYMKTGRMKNKHGQEYINKFRSIAASDRFYGPTGSSL